jgi:hypothetical protein
MMKNQGSTNFMVKDQGRKTFYKLISVTILMKDMLKTYKEQGGTLPSAQNAYKCNQV